MIIDNQDKAGELLPNYDSVLSDSPNPITYVFSNWAKGAMLLMPPREYPDQRPLYKIMVDLELNPLLPVAYTTKIFRSRNGEPDLVGEFSFALNHKRAVLRLNDTTARLSNALYSVNSSPRHFNWILENRLHWDCRSTLGDGSPVCVCYLPPPSGARDGRPPPTTESLQVASFISPPIDASPPLPDATLTIYSRGRHIMDEILMSALVVQRILNR